MRRLREWALAAGIFTGAMGGAGCEKPKPPSPDDGAIEYIVKMNDPDASPEEIAEYKKNPEKLKKDLGVLYTQFREKLGKSESLPDFPTKKPNDPTDNGLRGIQDKFPNVVNAYSPLQNLLWDLKRSLNPNYKHEVQDAPKYEEVFAYWIAMQPVIQRIEAGNYDLTDIEDVIKRALDTHWDGVDLENYKPPTPEQMGQDITKVIAYLDIIHNIITLEGYSTDGPKKIRYTPRTIVHANAHLENAYEGDKDQYEKIKKSFIGVGQIPDKELYDLYRVLLGLVTSGEKEVEATSSEPEKIVESPDQKQKVQDALDAALAAAIAGEYNAQVIKKPNLKSSTAYDEDRPE